MTTFVTQRALAAHLDCSTSTIANYLAAGTISHRKDGKYDQDECRVKVLAWLRLGRQGGAAAAGDLHLSAERAKLAQKQTESLEFKNALAKGEYVPIKVVAKQFEARILNARERLLSSISVIAAAVQSREHPISECEVIVRDRIYEALNDLASEADIDDDEDRAEAAEAEDE
jgi:phage terminase Nu1 subunit (DNA packaging protein)